MYVMYTELLRIQWEQTFCLDYGSFCLRPFLHIVTILILSIMSEYQYNLIHLDDQCITVLLLSEYCVLCLSDLRDKFLYTRVSVNVFGC